MAQFSSDKHAKILHISGDFPDPIEPAKTPVIQRLIDLTKDNFDHSAISLNRRSPNAAEWMKAAPLVGSGDSIVRQQEPFEYGIALEYLAPPKGVLHKSSLDRLGDWIAQHQISQSSLPDLIIGHKLTIEGFVASRLSQKLGIPFALSIQGNTDVKILKARPDLRSALAEIFHTAEMVFAFAPWARRAVEDMLGQRTKPTFNLPCATTLDTVLAPQINGSGLVTLFHLAGYQTKNLAGMARAMHALSGDPDIPGLKVMGGGSPADFEACKKAVGNAENIHFSGAPERALIPELLNQSTAFLMPSNAESFGLVFVEALFAGLPIIYPKDRGVDGYFDDISFAIAVNPKDTQEIARAIAYVCSNETDLKANLAKWQTSDDARQFTRAAIATKFNQGLDIALKR